MSLRAVTKMCDEPGSVRQVNQSTTNFIKSKSFVIGLVVGCVLATTIAVASYSLVTAKNYQQDHSSIDLTSQLVRSSTPSEFDGESSTNSHADLELYQLTEFKNRANRTLALYSMLEHMDESTLNSLWQESKDLSTRSLRNEVEMAIVHRLATLEPRQILTEIVGYPTVRYHELLEMVYEEWSQSDLEAAVTFAQNLDAAARETVLQSIMNSREDLSAEALLDTARKLGLEHDAKGRIARLSSEQPITDPVDSWNTFVGDHQHAFRYMGSNQRTLLSNITEALVEELGPDAFDLVDEALTDDRDKAVALGSVAQQIAKKDPKLAFELMLTHPPKRNETGAIWYVAKTWATSNPEAALDAVVKIKQGRMRNELIAAVVDQWTTVDPATLIEGVEDLPEKSRIYAERQAWDAFATKSPADASKLFGQLSDAASKERVAESIAANWAKSDVEATLAWIKSNQELDHIHSRLTSIALEQFAELDPNKAIELALAQPLSDSDVGPEADLMGILARHNIDASIELLNQSRNIETKLAGMISAGSTLVVYRGDPDGAMDLAKLAPSEEARDEYFTTLIRYWTLMKPETIQPRIDQFPTKELRSLVASYLIRREKKNFSADELEILHSHLTEEARANLEN